jgi:hypothetical protein
LVPGAGDIIAAIVAGCQALDMLIDALDTTVDAEANAPAPAPVLLSVRPPLAPKPPAGK